MRAVSQALAIPDFELIRAEKARRSLYAFVQQAWPVVEPGKRFVPNWHIEVICEHLEAVTQEQIQLLLINIPPRHSKSTIVTVMWPMWEWIQRPYEQYLCASYAGKLSIRDSVKSRRLINSPWYQNNWGGKFQLTSDQNEKIRWENDKTGYRIATSVGGTATGEGGSRLILDDPHAALEAQSETPRNSTLDWFDNTWSTRLNEPKRDAMVTIMQRLHEDDVSGHILRDIGGWEHLCIPAEWDGVKRKSILGYYDIRKKKDELLWPERVGPKELSKLKTLLGVYGASGQLQQDPSPAGGGIIKTEKFKLVHGVPTPFFMVQSLDTAFTKETQNDPTAFLALGMFKHEGKNCVCIYDAWDEHLEYPELRYKLIGDKEKGVKGEWHNEYGGDLEHGHRAKKPDVILIEHKGSGISLTQDLRASGIPVTIYNPGNADKISRAHQVAPVVDLGVVYVIESRKEPGKMMTWVRKAVEQMKKFPVAEHDDYVDAFTQCIIYLRDRGMFELSFSPPDEEEDRDYHAQKPKVNPYAT